MQWRELCGPAPFSQQDCDPSGAACPLPSRMVSHGFALLHGAGGGESRGSACSPPCPVLGSGAQFIPLNLRMGEAQEQIVGEEVW